MGSENLSTILDRESNHLVRGEGRRSDARLALTPAVKVLRGQQSVAAMRLMLIELSLRSGQMGAMDALDLFLSAPSALKKEPYLLLVGLRAGVEPTAATADELDGAVLIWEYQVVAEVACGKLLQMGAIAALISLDGGTQAMRRATAVANAQARIATRRRSVPRYLPLGGTFDATLATLGDDTRRNLRRYRRRVEWDLGAHFVAEVEMSRDRFLAVNRASTHPLEEAVAVWRYDLLTKVAGPVFCGVRAADGRWLSLLGGRRRPGIIDIDWQMNLAGMPRYSLSTVMRSFLLEHEIAQGTGRLAFVGGTPHPMRHSFVCSNATDVIVQRQSARAWLLRRLARWIFPKKSFLGQALRDKSLRWTAW
jgi:hypothetical protein